MTTNEIEVKKTETTKTQDAQTHRVITPETDIYETHDSFVIVSDMPGVDEQRVDITLTNNMLTIDGHVDTPTADQLALTYREYIPADYRRVFTLGEEIDRDKIRASLKNGVLRITLPKAAETQPKKINIEST